MKSLYLLLGSSLLLTACQRQAETKAIAAASVASANTEVATGVKPVIPVDTLSKNQASPSSMQEFLEKYNVGSLIELDLERPEPMNGFFWD